MPLFSSDAVESLFVLSEGGSTEDLRLLLVERVGIEDLRIGIEELTMGCCLRELTEVVEEVEDGTGGGVDDVVHAEDAGKGGGVLADIEVGNGGGVLGDVEQFEDATGGGVAYDVRIKLEVLGIFEIVLNCFCVGYGGGV